MAILTSNTFPSDIIEFYSIIILKISIIKKILIKKH